MLGALGRTRRKKELSAAPGVLCRPRPALARGLARVVLGDNGSRRDPEAGFRVRPENSRRDHLPSRLVCGGRWSIVIVATLRSVTSARAARAGRLVSSALAAAAKGPRPNTSPVQCRSTSGLQRPLLCEHQIRPALRECRRHWPNLLHHRQKVSLCVHRRHDTFH